MHLSSLSSSNQALFFSLLLPARMPTTRVPSECRQPNSFRRKGGNLHSCSKYWKTSFCCLGARIFQSRDGIRKDNYLWNLRTITITMEGSDWLPLKTYGKSNALWRLRWLFNLSRRKPHLLGPDYRAEAGQCLTFAYYVNPWASL